MFKLRFFLIMMMLNIHQFALSCECGGRTMNHVPIRNSEDLAATYGRDSKITPLMLSLYDTKMAVNDLRCVISMREAAKFGALLRSIEQSQKILSRGILQSQSEARNTLSSISKELPLLIDELMRQTEMEILREYFLTHAVNVTKLQKLMQ